MQTLKKCGKFDELKFVGVYGYGRVSIRQKRLNTLFQAFVRVMEAFREKTEEALSYSNGKYYRA